VIQGGGICRWKEYSSKSVLIYCQVRGDKVPAKWHHVAIQIPFERIHCQELGGDWSAATFWDENDVSHRYADFLKEASAGSQETRRSIEALMKKIEVFCSDFPFKRMVCDYLKKYKHLIPADVRERAEERRRNQTVEAIPEAPMPADPMPADAEPAQAAG
jgi:hypothetical protein